MEQGRKHKSIEIERSIWFPPQDVSFRLAGAQGGPKFLGRDTPNIFIHYDY